MRYLVLGSITAILFDKVIHLLRLYYNRKHEEYWLFPFNTFTLELIACVCAGIIDYVYHWHWRKWVCLVNTKCDVNRTYFQLSCMTRSGFLLHSRIYFSFCHIPEVYTLGSQRH